MCMPKVWRLFEAQRLLEEIRYERRILMEFIDCLLSFLFAIYIGQ